MMFAVALAFMVVPLLSGAMVQWLRPDARWMRLLLSFSGAFLLAVVFLHMLPELYEEVGHGIGLWILGGFLLQVVLEFFSHGIEHGHMHATPGKALPFITLASLCLHSFAEGMPFADAEVAGNMPFLAGVLLHKMPMAVALATVLQRSDSGGGRTWTLLVVFALAAPMGILAGHLVDSGDGGHFLDRMLALAIGMLLHISTTIIFESAPEHRFNAQRFAAVLVGAALGAVTMH
ncbi:MAG: ZIP family metal transporter [Flavobacteriales bacterium]|jgi:zinc transporter ZupT